MYTCQSQFSYSSHLPFPPWWTYICSLHPCLYLCFAHRFICTSGVSTHMWNLMASLVAQTVKNLPAMRETWVQSLVWENPLEKGMETHSSTLAWRIPWTEEPGGLQSMRSQRVWHSWVESHGISCCDLICPFSYDHALTIIMNTFTQVHLLGCFL